jgi:hypothetical protein
MECGGLFEASGRDVETEPETKYILGSRVFLNA